MNDGERNSDLGVALPRASIGWWCYIVAAVSIVVSVAIVAAHWSDIPEVIPTHWGPKLEPDAWSDKSLTSVYGMSIGNLVFLLIGVAISGAVVSMQANNPTTSGELAKVRTRAQARVDHIVLSIIVSMICLGLSLMQVTSVVPAFQRYDTFSFFLMLGCAFGSPIVALVYAVRAQGKVNDALRSSPAAQDSSEAREMAEMDKMDKHYKWGMFYYNPDDPTVLVEKRFGVGMDFNYATWQGKTFVAVILAVIIMCVALPFILS
ncbi:DUF5808 domain-containing protein [Corynebacterium falsenii]